MFPTLPRRGLLLGATVVALAAAGTGVALHVSRAAAGPAGTSSSSPSTQPSPPAASPGPASPGKAAHHHGREIIARVVSVTASSITVADPAGTQSTLTVAPKARIVGPDHKTAETLSGLPLGEVVILVERGPGPSAAASTPGPSSAADMVVVRIGDTGFKAA